MGGERAERKPTIAIIGASADRRKYGNKAVRAYVEAGYQVYPVNPRGGQIEGLTVYRSLEEVPVRPDWISVYVPPAVLLGMLDQIAAKGCDRLWLNPGTDSDEVRARVIELQLPAVCGCSIVALGRAPEEFPDQ